MEYFLEIYEVKISDIETERCHQNIFTRLVSYDKSEMKPTETEERILLPSQAGG